MVVEQPSVIMSPKILNWLILAICQQLNVVPQLKLIFILKLKKDQLYMYYVYL